MTIKGRYSHYLYRVFFYLCKHQKAFSEMEKEAAKETGEMCPDCGMPLVIRKGRYGEFIACSNYPECKYIKNIKEYKI